MRRPEAEQEAEQRNLEDERRDRLVFYALDESAGLSEDAWQVATRLRRPDEFQWELPGELPAEPARTAVGPPPVEEPPPSAVEYDMGTPLPAAAPPEPFPTEPHEYIPEPAPPPDGGGDTAAPAPSRARRGPRLVRVWGYFVMLVGVVFVAATLTISLGFRTYLQIGPLIVAALVAAGVFAIWVGAQIARPPH